MGGLYSRAMPLAVVMLISQAVGVALLMPIAVIHGWPPFDAPSYGFAIAGSIAGLTGLAAMYRGMSVGTISIVAPISATGAVVPVLFGVVRGERATPPQLLGMGLALVGTVLASRAADQASEHTSARVARGVGFAAVAALGFGGYFVLIHQASTYDV